MKIGQGRLTWGAGERRSDRYGFVYLLESGDSTTAGLFPVPLTIPRELVGKRGTLVATVIETRTSTHIGDLYHGIYPRIPKLGAEIVLGTGRLVTQRLTDPDRPEGWDAVGLKPDDGRETQWLDMRALYDAHEQTVELFFAEAA
jgi:hypothetical protein